MESLTKIGRRLLCGGALAAVVGCSGKTDFTSVDGKYLVDLTCVPTNYPPLTGDLRSPGKTQWSYTLSGSEPGAVTVTDASFGSGFRANLSSSVVQAADVEQKAAPGSANAALTGRYEEQAFYLSVRTGEFHDLVHLTNPLGQNNQRPDQPVDIWQACEGRVHDTPAPAGSALLTYRDSQATWSADGPAGACPAMVSQGEVSGALIVRRGDGPGDLVVYEEGIGCTLRVHSDDGVVYAANGVDCDLGPIGLVQIGFSARHFDSATLDFGAKTWTYDAHVDREAEGSTLRQQCYAVKSQFTGDLPAQ